MHNLLGQGDSAEAVTGCAAACADLPQTLKSKATA